MALLSMSVLIAGIGCVLLGLAWAVIGLRDATKTVRAGLWPLVLGVCFIGGGLAIPIEEKASQHNGVPGPADMKSGQIPHGAPPLPPGSKVPPGPPPNGAPMGHPPPRGPGFVPQFSSKPILKTKISVVTRMNTACSTLVDGMAACWGEPEPAGDRAAQIALGRDHGCSLMVTGYPHCWGDEVAGPDRNAAEQFLALTATLDATCALTLDGKIKCWGSHRGQPPSGIGYRAISSGPHHSCALDKQGEAQCWGCETDQSDACEPEPGPFIEVSAGHFHTCALREDGQAVCWGADDAGQSTPPTVRLTGLSAGWTHSCGIDPTDTSLNCWGCEGRLQEVIPKTAGHCSPPEGKFSAVSAGGMWNSCALTTRGFRKCWGGLARLEEE